MSFKVLSILIGDTFKGKKYATMGSILFPLIISHLNLVSSRVGVIKIVIVVNCNLITFFKVIACNCN